MNQHEQRHNQSRTIRNLEASDSLVVRIRATELTDTEGVADGQVQYYMDGATLKRKIFVRATGTWQAPA